MLSAVSNQKATAHLAEVRAVLGEGNASGHTVPGDALMVTVKEGKVMKESCCFRSWGGGGGLTKLPN